MSSLIATAKSGYEREIRNLLSTPGVQVDVRDKDLATPLYWAAVRGHHNICQTLLEHGADPNATVKWGSTPLHAACDRGHRQCVNVLVRGGADVNIQNGRKDTPLHLAAYRGYNDIITVLFSANADPFVKNNDSKTPLQEAESEGHRHAAQKLQEYTDAQKQTQHNSLPDLTAPPLGPQSLDGGYTSNLLSWPRHQSSVRSDVYHRLSETSDESSLPSVRSLSGSQTNNFRPNIPPHPGVFGAVKDGFQAVGSLSSTSFNDLSQQKPQRSRSDGYVSCYDQLDVGFSSVDFSTSSLCSSRPSSDNNIGIELASLSDQNSGNHQAVAGKMAGQGSLGNGRAGLSAPADLSRVSKSTTDQQFAAIVNFAEILQLELVGCRDTVASLKQEKKRLQQEKEELHMRVSALQSHIEDMSVKHAALLEVERNRVQELTAQLRTASFSSAMAWHRMPGSPFLDAPGQTVLAERGTGSDEPLICASPPPKCERSSLASHTFSDASCTSTASKGTPLDFSELTHSSLLSYVQSLENGSAGIPSKEQSLKTLQKLVEAHWLPRRRPEQLDVEKKEWVVGQDFSLVGDRPVNHSLDGRQEGSCSLVFKIRRHQDNKCYMLKMMINLINLDMMNHEEGFSLDPHLVRNFGVEYHVPLLLGGHPNIMALLHHYEGSTRLFQCFQSLLVPPGLDVKVEMASRTTFLVLEEYPYTLRSFLESICRQHPSPPHGLTPQFLLQLLFQLLAAVHHLQKHHLVHRDIKGDNVFMDHRLRPVLGDFGFARMLQSHEGSPLTFTDRSQVFAANSQAWAPELSRLERSGPEEPGAPKTLEEVYAKSDVYAVGRMLYSLLHPRGEQGFPSSTLGQPHYSDSQLPVLPATFPASFRQLLRQLVRDDPAKRPSPLAAMLSVGMLLFGPKPGEVKSLEDAEAYLRARSLMLLAVKAEDRLASIGNGSLSPEDSVKVNCFDLEAMFLTSATPKEFWETHEAMSSLTLVT